MTERALILNAVGDLAFGDHPLCSGFGAHSRFRDKPPTFALELAHSALGSPDILFGNLECTLSTAGLQPGRNDSMQMRGQPRYLEGLADTGFTVLNLANNHSLQHGEAPFLETVQMLRAQGIAPCGLGNQDYHHAIPAIVERNGLRVAFLGYSLRPRQYFTAAPLYAEGRSAAIRQDVDAARATADCVVVSLHWGSEFIDRPAPEDIALAHSIIDAGATLIIGHHPHVLRGIEQRGAALISYSLGNFVCDMVWSERLRATVVLSVRLTPGHAELAEIVPMRINDEYRPVPLAGQPARQVLRRIEEMSAALAASNPALPESASDYERAADAEQRANRSQSHRYFLRHLHRVPPSLILQQLHVWLRNRLAERRLLHGPDHGANC